MRKPMEDALLVCQEVLKRKEERIQVAIAIPKEKSFNTATNIYEDIILRYSNPLTIHLLAKNKLVRVLTDNWDNKFTTQPIGYYYIEFDLEQTRKWTEETIKDQLRNGKSSYNIQAANFGEFPFLWKTEPKRHTGALYIPSKEVLKFRGGNFGGLNVLIEGYNTAVSRELLRKEIAKNIQGGSKEPTEVSISKWKNDLFRQRKQLRQYLSIGYIKPNFYQLFAKNSDSPHSK
jgi:hypothetical protein